MIDADLRALTEHQQNYPSQWAAIGAIAAKFRCTPQTLHGWMRQAERDQGLRKGLTTTEREELKQLHHENQELQQANEPHHPDHQQNHR